MKRFFAHKIPLLLIVLAGTVAACTSNAGKPAAVVRVWPEYRTAESFDRISEYFTDKENPGSQIILRTHPETRAGYYFFTRMHTPTDITGARLELSVITPVSATPKVFTFDVPPFRKGSVLLNPGLTGADWADAKARPTAWRIRLLAADGSQIVTEQSYLWSK